MAHTAPGAADIVIAELYAVDTEPTAIATAAIATVTRATIATVASIAVLTIAQELAFT